MTGERSADLWPPGDGVMAHRIRNHAWPLTSLGAIGDWPERLRIAVEMMLADQRPASLAVGPARIFLFNDSAARIYGDRPDALLGKPLPQCFPSYPQVSGFYDRTFAGVCTELRAVPLAVSEAGREVFDATLLPVLDGSGGVLAVLVIATEVGEQRKDERAIRESEARHRLLIESWAQAVWETDASGAVVVDSPSWRAYTGQTLDEWLGYGWLDAIHPDDRAFAERQWREAIAAQGLVDAEFRLRAPGGEWRWTNVRAAPMTRANGQIEKWFGLNIDITARKQAEDALRESEEKYRSLFSSMDEAYAVVEVLKDETGKWADFRFLDANPAFLEHTSMPYPIGKTAKELLGRPNPRWTELYGQVLDSNEPLRVEETEPTLGRTFDLNIFPLDRTRNRVAILFTNITLRKTTEKALRVSEERLRQFGEASQDVLWIRDASTLQWEYLTPAFETIYGLSRAEALTGDTYRGWLDMILPEDREHANQMIERVRSGEHVTFEYRIRRPIDGAVRCVRNTDFPILDEAGNFHLIGGIGHDFTAVRETQHQLKILMEGIPQLVWRSADQGFWTWSSTQWQSFTGQTLEQSQGLGWLDVVHPDDREAATNAWDTAQAHGSLDVEFRVWRARDGVYLWHHTRSRPVRDESGRVIEWLGTTTDVQEMKELQERQKVMVAELQHRTRNLIAVIRAISQQTMSLTGPTEAFQEEFSHRLEALARVQGLLSRSDEEPITIESLVRMELDALGAIDDGRIVVRGPRVSLRNSIVQTFAFGLHELATNARKYGALSQNGGRLAVTWELSQTDDGSWRVALKWVETGAGMPDDASPQRHGYGRELIERALPYSLNAKTSYELRPEGVYCTIDLPLEKKRRTRRER
jgi:PAS domain S-box-containing protein